MKNTSERLRLVIFMALLIAINIILTQFIKIQPNEQMRFSLNFIPVVISAFVFGPWVTAVIAMVSDIVGMFFSPFGIAGLSPGITICQGLIGLIFGFMFYRRKVFQVTSLAPSGLTFRRFGRISLAVILQGVFVSFFLMSVNFAFMEVMKSTKTGWGDILANLFNASYMSPVIATAKEQFNGYLAGFLIRRLIQNAIMIPVEIVVISSMLYVINPLKRIAGVKS
jgi:ECF transporter S component (folate family)